MAQARMHAERHFVNRIGWLRAAVLGANDGIISTGALMVGVATASAQPKQVLVAGIAAVVAGAMSMAAGEFVSVSSQADTERADLWREKKEIQTDPKGETQELTDIYVERGVSPDLAEKVAQQLMSKDPLAAHARDELGISPVVVARPIQAGLTSAVTFTSGAAVPLLTALLAPHDIMGPAIAAACLVVLAILGVMGALAGGARILPAAVRVTFWGGLALAVTAGVGALVGQAV
ncbi:VIT1/CCC1 transporter family protein [Xanthobacter sp. TB0136]|uniref:VIT1/CCC1 transporter family protein n=1 Tax=Xanthobacter sp. TB0136 TaxID=3459177 RepID=UPI00403A35C3